MTRRRRQTICAVVRGVQKFALPICLGGNDRPTKREAYQTEMWNMLHEQGLDRVAEKANAGASEAIVAFFRNHDLAFRVRRLRFMARQLAGTLEHDDKTPKEAVSSIHDAIYNGLALSLERETQESYAPELGEAARCAAKDTQTAIEMLAEKRKSEARRARTECVNTG